MTLRIFELVARLITCVSPRPKRDCATLLRKTRQAGNKKNRSLSVLFFNLITYQAAESLFVALSNVMLLFGIPVQVGSRKGFFT